VKSLVCITGPVHSEKSTTALRIANRYCRLGQAVVLIRPKCAVRAHEVPGQLKTKNGLSFPSIDVETTAGVVPAACGYDVVWIDEPALFPDEPALYQAVQSIRRKSVVIVSGLSATSELDPFGTSMPALLAVADKIRILRADCDFCGRYGAATRSLCVRPKSGQVLVGGEESYRAACPRCWSDRVPKS
jgi:thymidine kinase